MKTALVIGGTNGLGLAMAIKLSYKYDKVYILGRHKPDINLPHNIIYEKFDLFKDDVKALNKFLSINFLLITAGIGRLGDFDTFDSCEVSKIMTVNSTSIIQILSIFSKKLISEDEFYCAVISSIAGIVSSPLYAVYSASKAALCKYIEAVNIELLMKKSKNVITNVAPGFIPYTSFNSEKTNLEKLDTITDKIICAIMHRTQLYIPDYTKTYDKVIHNYYSDPSSFGIESYLYKQKCGRINDKSLIKIGYLSGTFDLFHVGHLNLLQRAKEYCDYLIVGVHKDASHKGKETFISFEERKRIVKSIAVVDEVVESLPEDDAQWDLLHYDYLFVGSDYKGTERFKRYEDNLKPKGVKIIYFPYTQGTSSTKLRAALSNLNNGK